MPRKRPVIALITDFGDRDGYVGAMKGVLFSAVPHVPVIDVTHEITPFDALSAAYVLASAWDYFPEGVVFVCVVDPGVGTARRALVAETHGRYLIAPDNGVISLVVRLTCGRTPSAGALTVRELGTHFSSPAPSPTFHGRDVFAPAAARLIRGRYRLPAGPALSPVILDDAFSRKTEAGDVKGCVMHLDRFGNAVTSIRGEEIDDPANAVIEITARGAFVKEPYRVRLEGVKRTYADAGVGQPLAYVGSLGFIEIAIRNGNAAVKLGLRRGAPVRALRTGRRSDSSDPPAL